jgi:hypothetical protein
MNQTATQTQTLAQTKKKNPRLKPREIKMSSEQWEQNKSKIKNNLRARVGKGGLLTHDLVLENVLSMDAQRRFRFKSKKKTPVGNLAFSLCLLLFPFILPSYSGARTRETLALESDQTTRTTPQHVLAAMNYFFQKQFSEEDVAVLTVIYGLMDIPIASKFLTTIVFVHKRFLSMAPVALAPPPPVPVTNFEDHNFDAALEVLDLDHETVISDSDHVMAAHSPAHEVVPLFDDEGQLQNLGYFIDFYDHIIANQKTWISIDILDQHPEEANYADFWEAERENGSFPFEPSEELRLPMTQSYEDNQMMMMRFQEEIIADRERHNQE